jgi:hypothetical protein
MLAKHDFNTKFEQKIKFKTVGKLKNMKKNFCILKFMKKGFGSGSISQGSGFGSGSSPKCHGSPTLP